MTIEGSIDFFRSPRTFSGWVIFRSGPAMDLTVQVRRNGRLIAEGRPNRVRQGLGVPEVNRAGFTLACSEDIPDAVIALDELEITAYSPAGQSGKMRLWDVVRAAAFIRVLSTLSLPLTAGQALLSLEWLAKSRSLPDQVVTSLKSCEEAIASQIAQPVQPPVPIQSNPASQLVASTEEREFWLNFESLGGNCRLGQAQRHYGAEPLGLLRFAAISIDSVIAAIKDDFRGTGAPENTELRISADGEYVSTEKRYHMFSHTHIHTGQYPQDRLYAQHCKKLSFLARNMMEKIGEGSKIFVIHAMPLEIERDKLRALLDTLRSKGSRHLLYVRCGSSQNPAGSAYLDADGVLVGHVLDEASVTKEAFWDSWRTTCRAAMALTERQDIRLAA